MDMCGLLRRLPDLVANNKFDDDFFDRLNYSHTVVILTIFAIIVTNRQFSDNQIKCWVPAQFTASYEQYVNQICFITNTYSFDMHQSIPEDDDHRHEHELKYYQWTPFILLLMAIFFYIPHQFWRGLSLRSGVDLKDLVDAAQTFRSTNIRHDDRQKILEYLTNWLHSYCSNAYRLNVLKKRRSVNSWTMKLLHFAHLRTLPFRIYAGNYLMISYLFIKLLYLMNSIGQIFLLNALLGKKFWFYGIELVYRYWTQQIGLLHSGSEYFPKVVLCDFSIREPNHPKESHRYTVQCVLPFNLFNQQIFTYLYFWLIILSCVNFLSILIWLYRLSPHNNFQYLERRLTLHFLNEDHHNKNDLRQQFVYRYLRGDGTFMLRLITSNVSDYVCRKIILELFHIFHESLVKSTIGREPLFKSIPSLRSDQDDDENPQMFNKEKSDSVTKTELEEDEHIFDQIINSDIPPVPNPRQGRILIERDPLSKLSSVTDPDEHSIKESSIVPAIITNEKSRVRSLITAPLKDIQRSSEIHSDSSDRATPLYKNMEFNLDRDSNNSSASTASPPPSSCVSSPTHPIPLPTDESLLSGPKGPSPYATTYLPTKRTSEHELPYIDDSMSSGSNSGRLTNTVLVRQSEKPTTATTLASTDLFFRRSHDV